MIGGELLVLAAVAVAPTLVLVLLWLVDRCVRAARERWGDDADA